MSESMRVFPDLVKQLMAPPLPLPPPVSNKTICLISAVTSILLCELPAEFSKMYKQMSRIVCTGEGVLS